MSLLRAEIENDANDHTLRLRHMKAFLTLLIQRDYCAVTLPGNEGITLYLGGDTKLKVEELLKEEILEKSKL